MMDNPAIDIVLGWDYYPQGYCSNAKRADAQ